MAVFLSDDSSTYDQKRFLVEKVRIKSNNLESLLDACIYIEDSGTTDYVECHQVDATMFDEPNGWADIVCSELHIGDSITIAPF